MTTARDKFHYTRTLCCLLKALEGVETEIELRNDSHIRGTVESVTAAMNVTMRNCELTVNGRCKQLQRLLVQGRKIRMVIIPDDIDMIDAMQNVIGMYNVIAKGRNEFKKIPRAKQRGRGNSRGELRGYGRGQSGRGQGRGRGELTSAGRWRGRGAPYQNRGRGRMQTFETVSGESGVFGAVSADSTNKSSGQPTFDKHSVGNCSTSEGSMLRPEYMKQTSGDFVNPPNQESSHPVAGETTSKYRTEEDRTRCHGQDSEDQTSDIQSPAVSSTARGSAVASTDLRHKIHQLRHAEADWRHGGRSLDRRHPKGSGSSDRSTHRASERYLEASRSRDSDTDSGNFPEKDYRKLRKDKFSHSRHDKSSGSCDSARHTSHHSSLSSAGRHSHSHKSEFVRSQRTDGDSQRRLGYSVRQGLERVDSRDQRQRGQKCSDSTGSGNSHSQSQPSKDRHPSSGRKLSSKRKPLSGDEQN